MFLYILEKLSINRVPSPKEVTLFHGCLGKFSLKAKIFCSIECEVIPIDVYGHSTSVESQVYMPQGNFILSKLCLKITNELNNMDRFSVP